MGFPKEHRAKLHSTNPPERLNGEIKRRSDVVGIFPTERSIHRFVGALLIEQNDEWSIQRRYGNPRQRWRESHRQSARCGRLIPAIRRMRAPSVPLAVTPRLGTPSASKPEN